MGEGLDGGGGVGVRGGGGGEERWTQASDKLICNVEEKAALSAVGKTKRDVCLPPLQ